MCNKLLWGKRDNGAFVHWGWSAISLSNLRLYAVLEKRKKEKKRRKIATYDRFQEEQWSGRLRSTIERCMLRNSVKRSSYVFLVCKIRNGIAFHCNKVIVCWNDREDITKWDKFLILSRSNVSRITIIRRLEFVFLLFLILWIFKIWNC